MQGNRGQIEIEFLSLVSLVLIIFVLIYFLAFQKQIDVQENSADIIGRQLCSSIAFEIDQANAIGAGYEKNLTLPDLLGDKLDYSVDVDLAEGAVLVYWQNGACRAAIKAKQVSGDFTTGLNTVSNVAGEVVIN